MTQFPNAIPGRTILSGFSKLRLRDELGQMLWSLSAIGMLAVVYYLTAQLGLAFAIPPGNATAVWPPSGIALGALLLGGMRVCPGIWIGSLIVNYGTGVTWVPCVALATGNTLEALIALWLCKRLLYLDSPFKNAGCAFRLMLLGAAACSVAATTGALTLAYAGYIDESQFWANWSTWWLGDLAGMMLITPIFLLSLRRAVRHTSPRTVTGILMSLLLLGAVSQIIFGDWLPEGIAEGLLYLPLIVVFWLLLRFHPIVVCIGNLVIAIIAVIGTSAGVGPFATEVVSQSLFELQLFMTVYALAGLAMAGILTSQRIALTRESRLAARVQTEKGLRLKESELAHVSRLSTMGELVAGIAHEINQPLYAISNFAAASKRMLAASESGKSDQLRGLNDQITDQAVRAGDIIRRLRGFVRKTDGNRCTFLVSDAVSDAKQLLDFEARRMNVSVRIEAADEALRLNADKVQIEQVLVNLLRNAFDAMQDNAPEQRVATIQTSSAEGEVHISVTDQGRGIPEQSVASLFDAFFTTKESGMGMGLAISRTIVEAHGGRIWATPGSEIGTTFTVALPRHGEQ